MEIEDDVIGTRLYEYIKQEHADIFEMLVLSEETDEEGDPFIGFEIKNRDNERVIEFCSIEESVYLSFSEYAVYYQLYPKPHEAFENLVARVREIIGGEKVALVWVVKDMPAQADLIPYGDEAFFEFLYADADSVYLEGWSQEDDLTIR